MRLRCPFPRTSTPARLAFSFSNLSNAWNVLFLGEWASRKNRKRWAAGRRRLGNGSLVEIETDRGAVAFEVCAGDCRVNQPQETAAAKRGWTRLERSDDHQHDDERGGNARNFIEHAHGLARQRPFASGKLLSVSAEPALVSAKRNHQRQLGREPALAPGVDVEREHETENPHHRNGGIEDDRTDSSFAFDPRAILGGAGRRLLVIDVESGQQEQAGQPEDHERDVRRFDPQIGRPEKAGPTAHLPPFTSSSSSSTWAIGVS